jgi:hypothetical protein
MGERGNPHLCMIYYGLVWLKIRIFQQSEMKFPHMELQENMSDIVVFGY